MIVVDTNIIAYLFIAGENTEKVLNLTKIDDDWIAPYLWRSEFRNVLALYIRKNLLSLTEATEIMQEAEFQLRSKEYFVSSERVLRSVTISKCSAYDCEFVALARQFGLQSITAYFLNERYFI